MQAALGLKAQLADIKADLSTQRDCRQVPVAVLCEIKVIFKKCHEIQF